jgi:hypothetical protein
MEMLELLENPLAEQAGSGLKAARTGPAGLIGA